MGYVIWGPRVRLKLGAFYKLTAVYCFGSLLLIRRPWGLLAPCGLGSFGFGTEAGTDCPRRGKINNLHGPDRVSNTNAILNSLRHFMRGKYVNYSPPLRES